MKISEIKRKFKVGDKRASRIEKYFNSHPAEKKHIKNYHVSSTTDFKFLSRHPRGKKQYGRKGTDIGVDTYGRNNASTVYLYREHKK
jgi:hypothetical protein